MKQWWQDNRWWLAGLLAIYVMTTVPFLSRTPFNWDAAQFALGVQHFSVHMHQPHPPGYPLFILVGKVLQSVLSPNAALVLVSGLFGAAAVMMLYVLVLELWPEQRALAWWVALAWLLNPLFWLYREAALTYTIDAAAGITVAWLAWRTMRSRQHRYIIASVIVVTVAAGFRPSLLVLLLPLLLLQAWYHKRNWRFGLRVAGLGLVLWLAWLIPLVVLSGGWQQYQIDSQKLYSTVSAPTSILAHAPAANIFAQMQLVATTILESWNVIGLIMLMSVGLGLLALRRRGWRYYAAALRHYSVWLGLWIGPALLLYSLIHLGQLGYVVLLLPAGYIALAPAWLWLQQRLPLWLPQSVVFGPVVMVVLGLHAAVFLWLRPEYAHPEFIPHTPRERIMQNVARSWPNLFKMNRHVIAEQDAKHYAYLELFKQYDPAQTLVVTGRDITYTSILNGLTIRNDELFRELSAIAPEYHIIELGQNRNYALAAYENIMTTSYDQIIPVPATTHYIILAFDVLPAGTQPDLLLDRQRLPNSYLHYYLGIMDKPWHWLGKTIQTQTPL